MDKQLILKPVLSEKAYGLSQTSNTFVFSVPLTANKHTVARAVEQQFQVKVTTVNVANIDGKSKRTVRKSGRAVSGRQNATRKAYVTLQEGDTLPIFAALEESNESSGSKDKSTSDASKSKGKGE